MNRSDSAPSGRNVLVVDDDWDVQDAVSETLQDAGFQVSCATNGQEALDYLADHPAPDAILLDLFMPVMNGWDTARAIQHKRELSAIPLIVITASEPYWGYPPGPVLRKPIDRDNLVRAVKNVIASDPPVSPANGGTGPSRDRPS
jgi:DNA-binding NtrC family response regulator